jgi:hypothetical protein
MRWRAIDSIVVNPSVIGRVGRVEPPTDTVIPVDVRLPMRERPPEEEDRRPCRVWPYR